MVIVAGHVTVEPEQRESYLAASVVIVEQARAAPGCLDVAITGDLIDPGRVNIFERWESQAALEAFRRNGPPFEHGTAMLSVSVAEYDVADVRPLFGEGKRGPAGDRRTVRYEAGSTTLVTTQRCLPILRSRTNPSFS